MNSNLIARMKINKEQEGLAKSVHIKNIKNENLEKKVLFKSKFYYEVSEDSCIFQSQKGYCVMTWSHTKPFSYRNLHETLVPLNWALESLGYDMMDDEYKWRTKMDNDIEFVKELGLRMSYLTPITKSEYISKVSSVNDV